MIVEMPSPSRTQTSAVFANGKMVGVANKARRQSAPKARLTPSPKGRGFQRTNVTGSPVGERAKRGGGTRSPPPASQEPPPGGSLWQVQTRRVAVGHGVTKGREEQAPPLPARGDMAGSRGVRVQTNRGLSRTSAPTSLRVHSG